MLLTKQQNINGYTFSKKVIKVILDTKKINNNDSNNHTLNRTIATILSSDVKQNSYEIIKNLFDCGATICNTENKYNTLSLFLNRCIDHVNGNITDILIEIFDLLIYHGAKPNNSKSDLNTFSLAMMTKNIKIIQTVAKMKAVPNNTCNIVGTWAVGHWAAWPLIFYDQYPPTLSCAVETKQIEIIKLAHEHSALPESTSIVSSYGEIPNTLVHAILTGDPEIVKQIIIMGGRMGSGIYFLQTCFNKILNSKKIKSNGKIIIDRLFELMMCSGTCPEKYTYDCLVDIKRSRQLTYIESKVVLCYELVNSSNNKPIASSVEEIEKFRMKLVQTNEELVENPVAKNEIITTLSCVPTCIINIIHEYYNESLVQFIDWKNI
jgi:hypothetical protein